MYSGTMLVMAASRSGNEALVQGLLDRGARRLTHFEFILDEGTPNASSIVPVFLSTIIRTISKNEN